MPAMYDSGHKPATQTETQAKRTPGPWMVEPINDGETHQITTCERTGFQVLAETCENRDHAIDAANARLIAAAPDLLEAAKAKLADCRKNGDCSEVQPDEYCSDGCLALARAVEKAEGR